MSEKNVISPIYAIFALRELQANGVAEDRFFTGTSFNRATLESGNDIPMSVFVRLLKNAQHLTSKPLGLVLGHQTNIMALGSLGVAVTTSPNLREGFQTLASFTRIHTSYVNIRLTSGAEGMSLAADFMGNLEGTEKFHIETSFIMFQGYIEMVVGGKIDDVQFEFPYSKPDYAEQHSIYTQAKVSFEKNMARITVPKKYLDIHSPFFNSDLWQQSQALLYRQLKALSEEHNDTYTRHISAMLQSSDLPLPSVAVVANKMHLSERSLNRRLQLEGSNYRDIKNHIIHSRAKKLLLETDQSIESISALLGYHDTSNFRRAFKAQQDCGPKEFRVTNRST